MSTICVRLLYISSDDTGTGGPLTSHRYHLSAICLKKIALLSLVMDA